MSRELPVFRRHPADDSARGARARSGFRRGNFATALLLVALGATTGAQAAEAPAIAFKVGLARSAFTNLNANDAVAAYCTFLDNVGRRRGYQIKSEVTIYDDAAAFAAAIKQGTFHLATLDSWQFLEMEGSREIKPGFVAIVDGQIGRRYVVLARQGSGIRTVADLRGRAVLRLESVNNPVCRHWLETLVPVDPANPPSALLETLEPAAKPMAAVLPVFFGKKAACIVDETGFNLMKELNPQVGRALEIVAISPRLVDFVVCLGEQPWEGPPEGKADTVKAMKEMGDDPAGRQILTLFRISGMAEFQDEQLASVRDLRRTHDQLQRGSTASVSRP